MFIWLFIIYDIYEMWSFNMIFVFDVWECYFRMANYVQEQSNEENRWMIKKNLLF